MGTGEVSVSKWESKATCITYLKKQLRYFLVNLKNNVTLLEKKYLIMQLSLPVILLPTLLIIII